MSSAPPVLKIQCLLVWEPIDCAFDVDIETKDERGNDTTVDLLKRRIHADQAIPADIPLRHLSLYCVSIDLDDQDSVTKMISECTKRQNTMIKHQTITKYFPEQPNASRLHVLVDYVGREIPKVVLKLLCILNTDFTSNEMFSVSIDANANVMDLQKAIKDELGNHPVPSKSLKLFNIIELSTKYGDATVEHLKNIDFDSRQSLHPLQGLSGIFSPLPDECLHIVVRVPADTPSPTLNDEDRDTIAALTNRFRNVVLGIPKAESPSDSAKSSEYATAQKAYAICDGRNDSAPGMPIELFHPVFGHFKDDVAKQLPIPEDVAYCTAEYMVATSRIYANESIRRTALKTILSELIGFPISLERNNDNTRPDGMVKCKTLCGSALLLLKEDKTELANGHSDPSTQAGLSYARAWVQSDYEKIRDLTCCPTFLIASGGPWITILGAVFTDRVLVQRLTDFMWLGIDTAIHNFRCPPLSNVFFALRRSLERLGAYYDGVRPSTHATQGGFRFFPSITTYIEYGETVRFQYSGFLERSNACVTLRARTLRQPCKDIVVKFVDNYGLKAHKILAAKGLAPKLFYHGTPNFERDGPSYGKYRMVVMEYIEGKTFLNAKDAVNREDVRNQIREALKLLHDDGLVFGDLRPPNVMITNDDKVKLVDFNWAGEDSQARYPYLISSQIAWAPGVKRYAVMKKEHDLYMLEQLF